MTVFARHSLTPDVTARVRAEFEAVADTNTGLYRGWAIAGWNSEEEGDDDHEFRQRDHK